jgi:hypothetical protein
MKKHIIAIAIAAFSFAAAPSVQASDCHRAQYSYTKTIGCRTECRWAKNSCGRRYSYEVKVVTYADIYTDGSRRTYTKVVRG